MWNQVQRNYQREARHLQSVYFSTGKQSDSTEWYPVITTGIKNTR